MLFRAATLDEIAKGEVTLAFRVWDKPRAKPGGRQRTPVGELHIESVAPTTLANISETDAHLAGFPDRNALLADPMLNKPGTLWRIAFSLHADPRVALRDTAPAPDEVDQLLHRLDAMQRRSSFDPFAYLTLIEANPAKRAPDLTAGLGLETQVFKRQVRRLKDLGLTESLPVGYQLSVRGAAILAAYRGRR
ncbi:MAG: hypothetical protein AAF376_15745 [Pseudomonadota bacterium]